ncbi:MAG TPA: UDP-N-acetylmuramate dehydrogenase [Prolixibacteraceae bacterium]
MYKLVPNFSLKECNSFGIDVHASYWLTISSVEDWSAAMANYPHLLQEKRLVIGGGTNLLFVSDFDGLIISPDLIGYTTTYQDRDIVEIEVGAGEEWDDFVAYCVQQGWYGIENLSLIPGKVGAVPVQNIGAYGVEAESFIILVKGINLETGMKESFSHDECRFSYRSSIFKEQLPGSFMVTSVVFRLKKQGELMTDYGDLKKILSDMGEHNLQNLRKAVIQIRTSKLPDPKRSGNAGSFFKNPVVSEEVAGALSELLPGIPVYQLSEGFVKVGAGFLIDQAGWKGFQTGRAAVHNRQALVLVNAGGATGQEILDLSIRIQQDVLEKYGVLLEREVQVIGE